ncbi:opioid growth factor receptor-like [Pseudophryne corroboree]|uniref:opioid growth factor receptor-like n=1 Tax=Pseudophryne corroboree TaxID=495146 RepID=UPI003081BCA2
MYYDVYESNAWEEEYDSTWEEENPPENKKPRKHHQKKNSWNRAARDMQNYRHGYGNKFMPSAGEPDYMPNLEFYQNKIEFKPNGLKIEKLLDYWKEDYNTLESNHSYIQWLFPLQERGVNPHAVPLTMNEIEIMKKDEDITRRFLRSYKLMLGFYGISLQDEKTGEVARAENWKERFSNLDNRSHNNLRITRILKCLGELGYEHFQAPLVRFFLEETLCEGQLQNVKGSVLDYFMFTVKDKRARKDLVHFAWSHYKPQEKFIWGPVKKLTDYKPYEEKKIKENEAEGSQDIKEVQGKHKNCDMGNYESQVEGEPGNVKQSSGVSNYGNTDYTHLEKDKNQNSENDRQQDIISGSKNEENYDIQGENKQGVKEVAQTSCESEKEETVNLGIKVVPEQPTNSGNKTGSEASESTVNDKQVTEKGESDIHLLKESGDKEYEERANKNGVIEPRKQHISGIKNEENDTEGKIKNSSKEIGQTGGERGKEESFCSGTKTVLEQPSSLGNETGTEAAKSTGNEEQIIEKRESESKLVKESDDNEHEEMATKNGVMEPGKQDISVSKNEENYDIQGENKQGVKEVAQTSCESEKEETVNLGIKVVPEQPTNSGNKTGSEASESTVNDKQVTEKGESDIHLLKESGGKEYEERANKNGVIEPRKQHISGIKNEENDTEGKIKNSSKEIGQTGGERGKEESFCSGTKTVLEQPSSLGNETGTEAAKSTGNEEQIIEKRESESKLVKESDDNEHEEMATKNGVMEPGKQDISGSKNEENYDIQGENKHRVKETGQIGGMSRKEDSASSGTNIITVPEMNDEDKESEEIGNKNGAKETERLENKKLLESNSGTEHKNCCSIWDLILSFYGFCCHFCLLCRN